MIFDTEFAKLLIVIFFLLWVVWIPIYFLTGMSVLDLILNRLIFGEIYALLIIIGGFVINWM